MIVDVVGIIELTSIADGFLVLDTLVKKSPVTIMRAETINPGKYLIAITGDVASVEAAMDEGLETGGTGIHDHILLRNLDEKFFSAIHQCVVPQQWDALGFLETYSVVSALEAADTAVKIAAVQVVEIAAGNETGGKAILKINGPVGDVTIAMEKIAAIAREKGQLCRDVIIPGPHSDIRGFVCGN